MKLNITTAIAAIFSLFMFLAPAMANADDVIVQPTSIQQLGHVQPAGWFGRPWACSNHYFRRHHWRMCR